MKTEKILIKDEAHDIEVRPVTLVFNSGQDEILHPERFSITPEDTLKRFDELDVIDPYSACLFKVVVNDFKLAVIKKNISLMGFKHLVGLFSISLQMMAENKKFVWKYPESFLHPKYQLSLADVMLLMSNTECFVKFIRHVQKGYFDDLIFVEDPNTESITSRLKNL